jgi:cyclopropane fatty-acyl-phospholipid synthase-like methyltransferase
LKNLKVITRNVVDLDFEANVKFDRVCSTEMFEQYGFLNFLNQSGKQNYFKEFPLLMILLLSSIGSRVAC